MFFSKVLLVALGLSIVIAGAPSAFAGSDKPLGKDQVLRRFGKLYGLVAGKAGKLLLKASIRSMAGGAPVSSAAAPGRQSRKVERPGRESYTVLLPPSNPDATLLQTTRSSLTVINREGLFARTSIKHTAFNEPRGARLITGTDGKLHLQEIVPTDLSSTTTEVRELRVGRLFAVGLVGRGGTDAKGAAIKTRWRPYAARVK
jgi:hypothetical protein